MDGSLVIDEEKLKRITEFIMNEVHKRKSKTNYFNKLRNCLMFKLQFILSLRSKEVYAAKLINLKLDENKYYIPASNSKCHNQRVYFIPNSLIGLFKEYLNLRERFFPDSIWLFPTFGSHGYLPGENHVALDYYEKVFRIAQKRIGMYLESYIDKSGHQRSAYTPHGLRKGGATKILLKTNNVIAVKEMLGHTNFRSMLKYIEYAGDEIRKQAILQVYN